MRCYRKILRISCKDHVTNQEVRAKIQQAIGQHEYILTTVKRRQLQWYGHVSRSSGMAKTILQDTVKGGRRRGRQRKKWEDNISEWTGLEFTKSQRAVENREKWRKLTVKSSVVPQQPLWLRDRWDDDDQEKQEEIWWSSVGAMGFQSWVVKMMAVLLKMPGFGNCWLPVQLGPKGLRSDRFHFWIISCTNGKGSNILMEMPMR